MLATRRIHRVIANRVNIRHLSSYKQTTEVKDGSYHFKQTTIIDDTNKHNKQNSVPQKQLPVEPKRLLKVIKLKQLPPTTQPKNQEIVQLGIQVVRLIVQEWESNEGFRNWTRSRIFASRKWISSTLVSIKQSITTFNNHSISITASTKCESTNSEFILLPLPETTDEKIRGALNLPKTGPVSDLQILQLSKSDTICRSVIKQQFYSLAHKWHPDRFTETKEKQFAEQVFVYISQAHIRLVHSDIYLKGMFEY